MAKVALSVALLAAGAAAKTFAWFPGSSNCKPATKPSTTDCSCLDKTGACWNFTTTASQCKHFPASVWCDTQTCPKLEAHRMKQIMGGGSRDELAGTAGRGFGGAGTDW